MRYFLLTMFAIALNTQTALAWGPNGHRITAQVAQANLDENAAQWVESIAKGESLALMATWPDFIRSLPKYDCFKPWHFLTVDGRTVQEARKLPPAPAGTCDMAIYEKHNLPTNVVDAIEFLSAMLREDVIDTAPVNFESLNWAINDMQVSAYNGTLQATALALLVHLVGDVHQPLHVGKAKDRGGNTITVDWFGAPLKLHEVWDEAMIDGEKLSYTEYAAFLEQRFGKTDIAGFGEGPVTWAEESVSYRADIYRFGTDSADNVPRLGYEYVARQDELLKQRLYQGGKRLADILNKVFAAP
ncbi:S1/P1 nuclease [Pseudosulfitobacter sp. SM2401]|uniref:S1/P1 nuclease n=1 Tax=Pseudosulfitobacter sp. SM2401 TaxID=3350098 RepID=UPI0036F21E6F